jgi:Rrf2 family cysteine metabolism transcriptional repressor
MKISSKGDYALRAILTLALRNGEKKPVRLPEIAEINHIPIKFLEQIMIQLKGAGFVSSRRGRHGGYLLAKAPGEITMGEVIRLIDGSIAPVGCVSECDYITCVLEADCVIRGVFSDVRKRIGEIVDRTTFGNLCDRTKQKSPGVPGDENNVLHALHPVHTSPMNKTPVNTRIESI